MKNINQVKIRSLIVLTGLLFANVVRGQNFTQQQQPFKGVVGKTLADSKESWVTNPKAPKGSPNVVWIILDDQHAKF
jgi:hypothetical protein